MSSSEHGIRELVEFGIESGLPVWPHRREIPKGWAITQRADRRDTVQGKRNPHLARIAWTLTVGDSNLFLGYTVPQAKSKLHKGKGEYKALIANPPSQSQAPTATQTPKSSTRTPDPRRRAQQPSETPQPGSFEEFLQLFS